MSKRSPFNRLSMRIMGERSSHLDLARGRIALVAVLFSMAYIVVAARLVDVTLIRGVPDQQEEESLKKSEASESKAEMRRADVVDRNGILLATSLKTASLYADPKLVVDPVAAARDLNKIFPDLPYGDLLKKLQSEKRFVWIKRNLTPEEQKEILEIGEPGLVFDYDYRRIYPQGPLTSHMVGYADVDGRGLGGVERSFNKLLSTHEDPLRLTLDVRLQHILRREIQKAITDFTAKAGAGIIMDSRSGEILAAVSLPDFDPHSPNAKPDDPQMFNRVTLGVYELGSTFKVFTTAALLDRKKIPMSATFDASKPLQIGRYTIHDYHGLNKVLTVPETFMVSSNIGTARMAETIGTEGLKKFFGELGLMSKPEFEIDEVGGPIVPNPWRESNTLTASFGHGIAVTPLQLVSAFSAVVNGGVIIKPKLVKKEDSLVEQEDAVKVISKETSLKMRQLLRLVVSDGTAKKANIPGYMVGGKTGTADKNLGGRYDHNRRISAFVGAFPINDPQYTIFIMVDEPHPNKQSYGYATAGWVAAPAVGRVISSMGPLLNMEPQPLDTPDICEPLRQFISKEAEEH